MGLSLPGERRLPLLHIVLAVAAVVGLCALGCAVPERARRWPGAVLRGARFDARAASPTRGGRPDEAAAFVERALHRLGLRFGTDGSVGALWGYLRTAHELVPPADARPGDVLLFDVRGTGDQLTCADHAGIVESVTPDGRIGFVEARGGSVRHSFVDPGRPTLRRDDTGRVLNSFLRPKRITDPPEARYFAGEMLCAVVRVHDTR